MKRHVVDTNVPIVANGYPDPSRGAREPSVQCRMAAIDFLEALLQKGRVLMDTAGEVQAEYRRHLDPKRQPGVGDRFYYELLQRGATRIERVDLPKAAGGSFHDFPDDPDLAKFGPADQKFVALARRTGAKIAVATDSDWLDFKTPLTKNKVRLQFLCGADRAAWFTP
ncbi:MAG: hypothetical protein NTW56_00480 [Alphaproteobacteria bacterium]|nr:hypothetical protein [Alphaproteobacteria bacterium]